MRRDAQRTIARGARVALVAGAAALTSCSSATAVTADSLDIRFEVTGERAVSPLENSGGSTLSDVANSAGGYGAIVVLGRMTVPSTCFVLTPNVAGTSRNLDVRIEARSNGTCTASLVLKSYSLRIGGLRTGTYHLRVTHQLVGAISGSVPVLERDVVVN